MNNHTNNIRDIPALQFYNMQNNHNDMIEKLRYSNNDVFQKCLDQNERNERRLDMAAAQEVVLNVDGYVNHQERVIHNDRFPPRAPVLPPVNLIPLTPEARDLIMRSFHGTTRYRHEIIERLERQMYDISNIEHLHIHPVQRQSFYRFSRMAHSRVHDPVSFSTYHHLMEGIIQEIIDQ